MSKRNKEIILTSESKALKKLRTDHDYSLAEVSRLMNISRTRVHQMESGKENIGSSYIDNFLTALNIERVTWEIVALGSYDQARNECILLIKGLDNSKLEALLKILKSL
jgi:transcriptional regulator with XRE-family HTH domain